MSTKSVVTRGSSGLFQHQNLIHLRKDKNLNYFRFPLVFKFLQGQARTEIAFSYFPFFFFFLITTVLSMLSGPDINEVLGLRHKFKN